MLFVQGGSAHRIGLLYIIIQEQKEGIFHKKMFGKRTVWIINQMYIRAILRKGLLFISNHGLMSDMCQQRGPPKIFNRNRRQLLQGKYQGALTSCLMTPNLLLKGSACFQLSQKNQQLCLYFFIPGSADGAFAKVRSIYFNMEAPTLIFYCFFTAFCKKK